MEARTERSVVMGTDYSAASLLALPWAAAFAEALGARLTVVHVGRARETDRGAEGEFRAAMEILALPPRVRSLLGEPAEALVRAVESEDAELLVVAHQPDHDGIFGRSLSLALMRQSGVPVLAVHVPAGTEAVHVAPRAIREVVLGIDPEELGAAAVLRLGRFCARVGARLVLTRVLVDGSRRVEPATGRVDLQPGPNHAGAVEDAGRRLLALGEALPDTDLAVRVVVAPSAAAGLVALAIERGSDLVCTVARGRGRLAAALLGSATDDALRLSPLPVLAYGPNTRPERS
ncbi:MAG: hypothetical protein RIT45_1219 [Pseudomonadota bacterium]|jgi:nucleotide-binding universal stress UspA family protein